MTNLNHPRIMESDALDEAELDAAISRHFGPVRYREQIREFRDTIPVERMPRPIWNARRLSVAACQSDACSSGDKPCPTLDACRLPDKVIGARVGALVLLLSAVFVVSGIAAVIAWWPA